MNCSPFVIIVERVTHAMKVTRRRIKGDACCSEGPPLLVGLGRERLG